LLDNKGQFELGFFDNIRAPQLTLIDHELDLTDEPVASFK